MTYGSLLVALVGAVCIASGTVQAMGGSNAETELLRDLFSDYRAVARPVQNVSRAVNVYLSFSILQLNQLSTRDQFISVNGWITAFWQDFRLRWDTAKYGVEELAIPPNYVWLPELTLANTAGHFFEDDHYKHFKVQVNGEEGWLYWYPGGEFKSSCAIDVTYYPFDTQVCSLVFANWVFNSNQVNLSWAPSDADPLENFSPDGEWQILDIMRERREVHECCPTSIIAEVSFSILLRRRPGFYVMNIVCPSVIMSCLVLLLFWLPPEAGEKISMGLTLVLSFTIFILLVSENVPNSSLAVPLIEIYLFLQLGLTGLSVCSSILVLYIHHSTHAHPPPRWLITLLCLQRNYLVLQQSCPEKPLPEHAAELDNDLSQQNSTAQKPETEFLRQILHEMRSINTRHHAEDDNNARQLWCRVALAVDRACFVLFLAIFVVICVLFFIVMPRKAGSTFEELAAHKSV